MKLRVRGYSDVLSRKELCYLLKWAGKTLLGRSNPYVEVNVVLTDKMIERGSCAILDELYRPREFKMEICSKARQRAGIIKTILHEMVHVKQWVTGDMQDYARPANIFRWKKRIINDGEIDYYDEPWEKEAYRMELTLHRRYLRHLKKEGIKFV